MGQGLKEGWGRIEALFKQGLVHLTGVFDPWRAGAKI